MDRRESEGSASAPLSHPQRGVWVAHRVNPLSWAYNECALWRIEGVLDVGALVAALEAVTVRQPMLRTRFPVDRGVPCQLVEPVLRSELERVALDGADGDVERTLASAVRERMMRPFELAAAPPIRWTLFELGPRRYALQRVWHHILCDALSARAINNDIARAYIAARTGRAADLPLLATDYLAFSRRQADPAFRQSVDEHVQAWRARLSEAPMLALPTDFHRPAVRSMRGDVVSTFIGHEAVYALKAVGREVGATPFVTFLMAYAALLSRLSGDTDLVIGTAVAGRPSREFADVVGFFATMVACRIDLSGAPHALDAARRVQTRVREAIKHQAAPLEMVIEALGVPRDGTRHPLFQVAFGMRKRDLGDLALEGAEVHRVGVELGHARFDLTLQLLDGPDGVELQWNYAADVFEGATVERMARQYAVLVEAIAREPLRSLATLPLMDDSTRARLVAGSCGQPNVVAGEATVHRRVAAQAALRPDARAIAALSYAELDTRANRLAGELVARGVGPGRFIAVARELATDVAIAWLAVLKAGAAYVPIDPEVPDERLAHMLADAQVAHAIADASMAPRLARGGVDVICPETDAERIAARPAAAPPDATGPDDAAYVIYTSGSSGRPKGVVVPHRSIVGLVCGADYAPIAPGDRVAQMAPPAFDASTFEFWGPLLNGATIVPVAKVTALAPRALAETIASERVTTMFVTTALFEAVAREAPDAFAPCRTVLFGGEAVDPRRVADVLRAGAPQRLVHVYGPTETTTFATWHEVRAVDVGAITVPIGRAIAQAEVFVLRDDGEVCAPGEPGEIVIGGSGVALGYIGGTEADARRFVVAPVGDLPPRRLYRSGDRARMREDGAIEFLGRLDGQVKVRGHRIELEDVEAAIVRQPGVRDAAAVLLGDTSDTRRIVAYVVPADPSAAPPDGIRRALRRVLPPTMLPSEIAWVPALPLNASGKVDRTLLPTLDVKRDAGAGARDRPRDPLERDLTRQWEAALGRTGIGLYDRFFDLGGNSLLAARMVDDYERETGIRVPLTAMFVDDTVAGVAQAIREGALAAGAAVVPLHERGSRPPFVYAHGDFFFGGFHTHALARELGTDQPVYVVHPHGLAGEAVPATIEAMAADRLPALRALRPHGPYVIGGHCNGAHVAFELARLLLAEGEQVLAVIVVDSNAPSETPKPAGTGTEEMIAFAAAAGLPPPTDRMGDIMHRYFRAMRTYRGRRADVHMVIVRSSSSNASTGEERWAALASSVERHVLPGDHISLVMDRGREHFASVIRDVVDRAIGLAGD